MNPIYKFELSANGATQQAYPVYGDSLAISYDKETNQEFFRATLSGELTFKGNDYAFIYASAFDTQFILQIYISYNAGLEWTPYWQGTFWKTDCSFDDDDHTATVQPTVNDRYGAIMAGLDKEYNLIDLAPEIMPVTADKRPMTQIYVLGETTIGCFVPGAWWEKECEPVTDSSILTGTYHFALNKSYREVNVSGSLNPDATGIYIGESVAANQNYIYAGSLYSFRYTYDPRSQYVITTWEIIRNSDNVVMWRYQYSGQNPPISGPITLTPVSGTGATGTATASFRDIAVYARLVTDLATFEGVPTYPMPDNDIAGDNRNYHYIYPSYNIAPYLAVSNIFSSTPTQWGLYQPGQYYQSPDATSEYYPVGRKDWTGFSLWFLPTSFHATAEALWRSPFTIKDAYPLYSVISVLLGQIAPGISHQNTLEYSQFLYGANLIGTTQTLLITPKSNIINSGYDQPAQKAPITLRNVLDMLRDCFRGYWWIDEQNRLRIEHIQYFRNGGSYNNAPSIGVDLTTHYVTRNGKSWAFAKNQYKFNKPSTAARYQFGWMDDATQLFEGYPIDIVSKYVEQANIEQITVANFNSDIDYILLNPSVISQDGFVLLAAVGTPGQYSLPYVQHQGPNNESLMQNGYVAFVYLQQYYFYDMPALLYRINGETNTAIGTKRLKQQTVNYPAIYEPDLMQLIKTQMGNGAIEKISINLSSRNATVELIYDTEQ